MGMVRGRDRNNPPVVVSRADVKRVVEFATKNCSLEDYVLVRLFWKLGPRTSEVSTLAIEDVDFETCHIRLLDSKKYEYVRLPLDVETIELIRLLIGNRKEGYVFKQKKPWKYARAGKPLHKVTVYIRIKNVAEKAGVKGFHPRVFRWAFSADWHYKKGGSLKGLQHILRHDSLASTDAYVSKLYFEEDLDAEYLAHMDPIARALNLENLPPVCRDCPNSKVCKYVEETPEWMTGCNYKDQLVQKRMESAHVGQ